MKRLDGREVADYLKERHSRQVRALNPGPQLAIVRVGETAATTMYLRVKQNYGREIGVPVHLYTETGSTIMARIHNLNNDTAITGINIELPFADAAELTGEALAAVTLPKDIEGLAPGSQFEVVTPKAIMWLLAAYNLDVVGKTVVIAGQGRLVGQPLAARLRDMGVNVVTADVTTAQLPATVLQGDIVITATGSPAIIMASMLKPGAVVIDAGAPASDVASDVAARPDVTLSPNPGGVGPMTVAALFDNLLIAAQRQAANI